MSGFTNIQVLDCSRSSSAEGIANNNTNPAEFTNELGSGVVLSIGDEISVHSAYVSELGAEAGEIEIKSRLVRATDENKDVYSPIVTDYKQYFRDELLPTKYSYETSVNAKVSPIQGKDQETNLIISPYKTSNGEFYALLPRKWIGPLGTTSLTDVKWLLNDTLAGETGNVGFTLDESIQLCPSDQRRSWFNAVATTTPSIQRIKNDNSRYTIFRADVAYFNSAGPILQDPTGNTKFTGLSPAYAAGATALEKREASDFRDVATIGSWNQVRDVLTLSATEGFNSPADVATEITLQMNKREDAVNLDFYTGLFLEPGLPNPPDPLAQKITVSSYNESPTYKVYNAASHTSAGKLAFEDFRNTDPAITDLKLDAAHAYMSSYQHLGVKRPAFFTQGRLTNASGGYLCPDNAAVGNSQITGALAVDVLNLGIPWTQENIDIITKLLDVQGTFPDLFTDKYQHDIVRATAFDNLVSVVQNRFLHFNSYDDASHHPKGMLGYDLFGDEAAFAALYTAKMATSPVFFDYNASTVNLREQDVGYAFHNGPKPQSDYKQLASGWARKVKAALPAGDPDYFTIGIQFTTLGDRVPDYLSPDGRKFAQTGDLGRRFGFDYHFTAYGNPCMMLTTGQIDDLGTQGRTGRFVQRYVANDVATTNAGHFQINQAYYDRKIYLGADEPTMGFNTDTQRFELSDLHTSEREGNVGEAGSLEYTETGGAKAVIPAIPVNPNSGQKCYKINKRLLSNNYCVSVAGYEAELGAPGGFPYPATARFSQQMEPWIPYDAVGGIFIEEFVVPQFNWDTNLIGVMGYRYSQINTGTELRQVRIQDYKTAGNMITPTTNAKINQSSTLDNSRNGFNAPVYNLTLGTSVARTSGGASNFINNFPSITTVGVSSTTIAAQELPTKSLKPYYTIRSDIINDSNWIAGSNSERPGPSSRSVVGIVDKVNGYADFFTQESSQLTFTNTVPRVISSIRTSIHDPDGTFADVDLNSSIIYMIRHKVNTDLTPVETLLASKKKSDQLEAQKAEMMLKNPADMNPSYNGLFK